MLGSACFGYLGLPLHGAFIASQLFHLEMEWIKVSALKRGHQLGLQELCPSSSLPLRPPVLATGPASSLSIHQLFRLSWSPYPPSRSRLGWSFLLTVWCSMSSSSRQQSQPSCLISCRGPDLLRHPERSSVAQVYSATSLGRRGVPGP